MIQSIEFTNFRVLRDARLPLSRCSLLLGPNGSGKSTAIRGLGLIAEEAKQGFAGPGLFSSPKPSDINKTDRSNGASADKRVNIAVNWLRGNESYRIELSERDEKTTSTSFSAKIFGGSVQSSSIEQAIRQECIEWLSGIRIFSFDSKKIASPARLQPNAEIGSDGSNLAAVLTQLQDKHPERFEDLNDELGRWLPEFDRVLFDTGLNGERILMLRTKIGRHTVVAEDLSDGVLLSLCIMSLSYLPNPPTLVCLEEPDRGIHPRLLRQIHDAMMRLSNPDIYGDSRDPVQVLVTTHSPHLLDLFRDHPEDVVLAEKGLDGATFHKIIDMPHFKEILSDAPLGDAWYTGILGGVPATP